MKKVLNFGSLLLMLTLLLSACGKDPKLEVEFSEAEMGRFSVTLGTIGDFEIISKAEGASVDVTNFVVRIYGTTLKNTAYDQTWNKYSEMPSVVSIPAGSYTIEAYNGTQTSGFETPYYYGSREFSLGIQEYAEAQVTCQLACVKLSVEFTDLFTSNVSNPSCLVHSTDGVSLEFDMTNHTKIGYIAAPTDGRLAVTIRGQYVEGGGEVDKTFFIPDVVAKQWHKIKLSVNTEAGLNNTGGMIQLDHTVSQKDQTILVPGSGDVIGNNGDTGSWEDKPDEGEQGGGQEGEAKLPVITGKNLNGKPFDITQPIVLSEAGKANVTLEINLEAANGGIQDLLLSMSSTDELMNSMFVGAMGATESSPWNLCDLSSMNEEAQTTVQELGIVDPAQPIRGKTTHLFSIGGFMNMVTAPADGIEYFDHSFKITIVDVNGGRTTQTLLVRVTK